MSQRRRSLAVPVQPELRRLPIDFSDAFDRVGPGVPESSLRGRSRLLAHGLAFAGGAGLILAYALRGGAYDIVVFEEYGFVIWTLLAIGIALRLLPRTKPTWPAIFLIGALLAYSAWTALSLTWTQSSELTFEELARSLGYVGLVMLVAFALDHETWRSGAAGLGFGAFVVCVLAVASRLVPADFPANIVGATFHTDRLSYPFGYWNSVGAWGAMSTAIGLAWSAHDRIRVRRAVALALVPAASLATYLSYSRAGAAGLALAVILALGLSRSRLTALIHSLAAAVGGGLVILAVRAAPEIATASGTKGAGTVAAALVFATVLCAFVALATNAVGVDRWAVPRRAVRPLAIAGLVAVLIPGAVVGPRLISQAWHSFTRTTVVQSADPAARLLSFSGSRYTIWQVAMKAFDQNPATGTGAGTFEFWWNQHGTDVEFLRDSHSLWVENLSELGAPGFLLIVVLSLASIAAGGAVRRRARRRATAGASAAFLAAFMVYLLAATFDWMWESTAVTVLALAGIAAVTVRAGRLPVRFRWSVRTVLVVLAMIGAAVQVPGLLSTVDIRHSQAAERGGHGALALAYANDAIAAEPWATSAYEQRGLVLESGGRLADAARDLHRAVDHERTNYAPWLLLARIEAERGLLGPAGRDLAEAHHLRPLAGVFLFAGLFKVGR